MALDLSIISICLNDAEGLDFTLSSCRPLEVLLGQSFEHIVYDSSPQAHQAVRQRYRDYAALKWIEAPANGIYPALNEATKIAQGKVIWHLNSGDLLVQLEEFLKALNILLASQDAELLFSTPFFEFSFGSIRQKSLHPNLRENLLSSSVCHQGILFKRKIFEPEYLGLFNVQLRLAADYDWLVRFCNGGWKAIYFEESFTQYNTSGRSSSAPKACFKELGIVRKKIIFKSWKEKIKSFLVFYTRYTRAVFVGPLTRKLGIYRYLKER